MPTPDGGIVIVGSHVDPQTSERNGYLLWYRRGSPIKEFFLDDNSIISAAVAIDPERIICFADKKNFYLEFGY